MCAMVAARHPSTGTNLRLALVYMVVAAVLWATIEGIGAVLGSDQHPIEVVWMRYATHLTLLLIVFGPRRKTNIVQTARPRLQISRGLLMLLMPVCFLLAVVVSDPSAAQSVFWISPLLTMLLAVWLLGERVAPAHWLIAAGGWLGALLLYRPNLTSLVLASIPALGMAGCLSLYLVMTRILRDESTLTNLFYTAACVLIPLSVAIPFVWNQPTVRSLAIMTAIGLLGLGVLFSFDRATELAPVSAVAPMLYLQPVSSFGLAIAFDEFHPGWATMLGTTLILLTCAIMFSVSQRHETQPPIGPTLSADQPVSVRT